MYLAYFVLIYCTIGTSSVIASVGKYTTIGRDVKLDPTSRIDNYASIGDDTSIGANSKIGKFSNIGHRCTIENDVILHEYVKIGNGVKIRPQCKILSYVVVKNNVAISSLVTINKYSVLGENVKVDSQVTIDKYAKIDENVKISEGAALDAYSHVGSSAEIKEQSYIGTYSSIQPRAVIGNSAVIHKYVEILSGERIPQNQVVIRRPTSYELYRSCAPIGNIQSNDIQDAENNERLNERLHQLIDSQYNTLVGICTSRKTPTIIEILPIIKTLYLINYHGHERFKEYQAQIRPNTDQGCTTLRQLLDNEFHFDGKSKDVLTSEVKTKFIQLLALELDLKRTLRVEYDTACTMIDQIQQGIRDVKCQDRKNNQCKGGI